MDYFRFFRAPSKLAQELLYFSDGMGHLKSDSFLIDRSGFNNYLIMYVLSGKLHVEQNGHHILMPGDAIIMSLMGKHKYYTDNTDICEILWLHFNGWQCESHIHTIGQKAGLPFVFREERIALLINNCFKHTVLQDNLREFMLSETIYSTILTVLHKAYDIEIIAGSDSGNGFKNKVDGYIENNMLQKISLEEFARHFNISPWHFCRIFKKYFSLSPMKYVLQKKTDFSKYLLIYTNDSISSIAEGLGFTDQSHFSRTFLKYQKQTPNSYRKERPGYTPSG